MNATDFYAVIFQDDVYCLTCLPRAAEYDLDTEPIFADSEWDSYPVCDRCGREHDYVNLTTWTDENDEPTEDDLRMSDERHVYQYGKLVLTLDPESDRDDQVVAFMEREQFFPNFYVISDHGNPHLVDLTDAFARFEHRKARRSHLLSFIRRGWCVL